MTRIGILTVAVLLVAIGPALAGTVQQGSEFRVNTYTIDDQEHPDIASDRRGGFVVVWEGDDQDGDQDGIFGQRYDSTGQPVGPEFQVNSYTPGDQFEPAVAVHPSGGFVVVWTSVYGDGSSLGVVARRFDETGSPVGLDFQVNTWTTGNQYDPDVAIDEAGDFMVVWVSYSQAGTGNSVFGQLLDRGGLPVGSEFQVDTYTAAYQYFPQVAADSRGDFAVVWESYPLDGNGFGIAAQIYDSSGLPVGGNFQVNTYTSGDQGEPGIAMNAQGDFLVAWDGDSQDGSQDGVFAQLVDVNGNKVGAEIQVNSYTTGQQDDPRIAADSSGDFVVVWPSSGQDGSGDGVFGQLVSSTGSKTGSEFQVNTYTINGQARPSVAFGPPGTFTVAWESYSQDGSYEGVYAQRFAAHSPALAGPAGPLDCSDPANPATRPTFTWDGDTYDVFKVFMGSSPGFEKGTRVTSGDKAIKTTSWTPNKKKWKRACKKAIEQSMDPNSPLMYVSIFGKDRDLPKKDPSKKRFSPAVEFDVTP